MARSIVGKVLSDPGKACAELLYQFRCLAGSRDYQSFLVLSRSRVGSTLLTSSLHSHPEICCRGEKLNFLSGRKPADLINRVYGKHPASVKAVGFKIFYGHPNDCKSSNVWEILNEIPDLKVIHLRRENILRTLVSRKIAEITGQYDSTYKTKNKVESVHFEYQELLDKLEKTSRMEAIGIEKFTGKEVLEVTYEQLTSSDTVKDDVQKYLGVTPVPLTTKLKKQNPQKLNVLISNYDELEKAFSGSRWHKMFIE